MSAASKLARVAVVLFSLTLLGFYVWHSQNTPNTPPPDPFGLNGLDLTLEPEVAESEGFVDYGNPLQAEQQSDSNRDGSSLRIISSKVINQPVFSVRKVSLPWETTRHRWNARKGDPFTLKPDIRYEGYGINLSAFTRE